MNSAPTNIGRRLVPTALCVALALVAGRFGIDGLHSRSADAASPSVVTGSPSLRFTPNVVNITTGDTVTFTLGAGTHIVDLKDVSPDLPIDAAHTSGTTNVFSTAGTYYYYCSIHASVDLATEGHVQANDAMVGKIVVAAAAATPTATSTATPTATTASATPTASAAAPTATATRPATVAASPTAAAASPTVVVPQAPNTGTGTVQEGPQGWSFALLGGAGALVFLAFAAAAGGIRRRS